MAQALFAELYPDVSSIVKGAPNPTMLRALQKAAREFYSESNAYRYTIAATDVAALTKAITIVIPDDTEIHMPGDMTLVDNDLTTTSMERGNAALGRWDDETQAQTSPSGVMRVSTTQLALLPLPSGALTGALNGTVVLIPTRTAPGIEEQWLDEDGDALSNGAVAKLATMKGTDWYAPDIAPYYNSLFQDAIWKAGNKARNEHTHNRTVVSYGGI